MENRTIAPSARQGEDGVRASEQAHLVLRRRTVHRRPVVPPGTSRRRPVNEQRHPPYAEFVQVLAEQPQLRSVNAALGSFAVLGATSAAASLITGIGCPWWSLAGYHCAFSGATRSVVALLQGDHWLALRNNGLVVLALSFVLVRGLLLILRPNGIVMTTDLWIERVDLRIWIGALLIWTVLRNLSWFWFLAPVP